MKAEEALMKCSEAWRGDQKPGDLLYITDAELPSYIGIHISHCKHPHEPISGMECH